MTLITGTEDKDVKKHIDAVSFLAGGSFSKRRNRDMLRFNTLEELRQHLASI